MLGIFASPCRKNAIKEYKHHKKSIDKLEDKGCLIISCMDCSCRKVLDEHISTCPREYHIDRMNEIYKKLFDDYEYTTFDERTKRVMHTIL